MKRIGTLLYALMLAACASNERPNYSFPLPEFILAVELPEADITNLDVGEFVIPDTYPANIFMPHSHGFRWQDDVFFCIPYPEITTILHPEVKHPFIRERATPTEQLGDEFRTFDDIGWVTFSFAPPGVKRLEKEFLASALPRASSPDECD